MNLPLRHRPRSSARRAGTKRFPSFIRPGASSPPLPSQDVRTLIRRALTEYKQGRHETGITLLREGLRQQPREAELHYQLGILLAAQEDFDAAEPCFKSAISCDPSHARAHERLAQIESATGRHQKTLGLLEKAHQLDPSNGRVAFQLQVLNPANTASSRATETGPNTPLQPFRLDAEAWDRLGQALIHEPDFVETFLSLPEHEVDRQIFSMLAATLERALQNHPEYADLHYHCGAVYRRLGRRQDAIRHAERAVQINPRYVNALILLAELYGQTDQWAVGVERLDRAVQAGADYPDVHYLLSRLCQGDGQLDRARQAYRRALDLNGSYRPASDALAALPV